MVASSAFVMGNSVRLRRFGAPAGAGGGRAVPDQTVPGWSVPKFPSVALSQLKQGSRWRNAGDELRG